MSGFQFSHNNKCIMKMWKSRETMGEVIICIPQSERLFVHNILLHLDNSIRVTCTTRMFGIDSTLSYLVIYLRLGREVHILVTWTRRSNNAQGGGGFIAVVWVAISWFIFSLSPFFLVFPPFPTTCSMGVNYGWGWNGTETIYEVVEIGQTCVKAK